MVVRDNCYFKMFMLMSMTKNMCQKGLIKIPCVSGEAENAVFGGIKIRCSDSCALCERLRFSHLQKRRIPRYWE